MSRGRDLDRLLWAVGEARRLRRAESDDASGSDPLVRSQYAELDDRAVEQSLPPSS